MNYFSTDKLNGINCPRGEGKFVYIYYINYNCVYFIIIFNGTYLILL